MIFILFLNHIYLDGVCGGLHFQTYSNFHCFEHQLKVLSLYNSPVFLPWAHPESCWPQSRSIPFHTPLSLYLTADTWRYCSHRQRVVPRHMSYSLPVQSYFACLYSHPHSSCGMSGRHSPRLRTLYRDTPSHSTAHPEHSYISDYTNQHPTNMTWNEWVHICNLVKLSDQLFCYIRLVSSHSAHFQ